jgi:trehalose 6-phosphate synthase/phosphatase
MPRLVVVSNRLPFTLKKTGQGFAFSPSSGGLVTALGAYLERERERGLRSLWVGWPGCEVADSDKAAVSRKAESQYGCAPVYLSEDEAESFYHGFCNKTLWPLFHYFTSYAAFDPPLWTSYVHANQRFCDALSDMVREDDTVWIHDYQLMLLPAMLRERHPKLRIGFFLHIPFPSFEIFRMLPSRWRSELLQGVLGADLSGFHTHDYAQYFLRSVYRTLGHDHHLGQLRIGERLHRVDTFPIGIDYAKFYGTAQEESVSTAKDALIQDLGNRKIIFSVDRLDYSKGLLHRLRGYETFLASHPEWHEKVFFVLGVVPSREEVPAYKRMLKELNEAVGIINGRFGKFGWVPLIYQYRSIPFHELVTLYRAADIALITPLRDGMNLVAKEYVACRTEGDGVLILSEMAGAARELGEAMQVNPYHEDELAEAIATALSMPQDEQVKRMRPMQERMAKHDATAWVESFLTALGQACETQGLLKTHRLDAGGYALLGARANSSRKRLLLLDYDGTLVPFAPQPHLAAPDAALLQLLDRLARTPEQAAYIVSGRDRHTLDAWVGELPVSLIAEHGAWLKPAGGEWRLLKPLSAAWKPTLRPILQNYTERLSGALIEEKDFSLAWHYRKSDPDLGMSRAKELVDDLVQYTANFDVQILEGSKVVEIRNSGVNKGAAALHAVSLEEPDFILAVGDDQTDEDLFRALPEWAVTVRVGHPFSNALYSVRNPEEVRQMLAVLGAA